VVNLFLLVAGNFKMMQQQTVLLSLPLEQLQTLIIDAVNACLDVRQNQQSPQPEPDQLLTIQPAAELLHLSVPTMYTLVSKGEIPVSKKGKRLYFSKQELTSWIKSGRKKTSAEIAAEANHYIKSKAK
jgi:excisionase family DNA binding protein